MTTTATSTADVTKVQLDNALQHLRHALRCATPLISAVDDGHLAAQIATAAGQTAEAARSVAGCLDTLAGLPLVPLAVAEGRGHDGRAR
jgi:hypothetical protein